MEDSEEKIIKLKSANKCAWLLSKDCEPLYSARDDEDGLSYLVFELDEHTQQALNAFYKPETAVELGIYSFIRFYKLVRQQMKDTI